MTSSVQARSLLAQCGECAAQHSSDWRGSIPLPPGLVDFYREVGPHDIRLALAGGDATVLPTLRSLWDLQVGFRIDGLTGEAISAWPQDWFVIAAAEGDAFVFDAREHHIIHAVDGVAPNGIQPLFDSPNTMAASLGALELTGIDFNEDGLVLPKYRTPLLASITNIVGSEEEADRVLTVLGYSFAESDEDLANPKATASREEEQDYAASRHRFAAREAIRESDAIWKAKDYRGVITTLEPYERDLDSVHAARLQYCRKRCQSESP